MTYPKSKEQNHTSAIKQKAKLFFLFPSPVSVNGPSYLNGREHRENTTFGEQKTVPS
jgi:hypothetical protein